MAGAAAADGEGDPEDTVTIVSNAPDKVGKYRITGVIGEGVSGVVYKAFDVAVPRVVAVKSLHGALAADSRAARAFAARLREHAQAVGRLAHPGVVAIHEIDEHEGRPYIAMEHVAGLDLGQWLGVTPLPAQAVLLQVMDQLLDALEAAHAAGVRHGDVKPSNVLIAGSGQVKLSDFGLARAEGRAGASAGIAPEYVTGRLVDHRVDIYAAGAILYRMLTGREAFADAGEFSGLGATLRPPSMVAEAQRPPVFDAIVARALAHDPNQRYASAADFRDALRRIADPRLPERGARVVTLGAPEGAAEASFPVLGETPAPAGRQAPVGAAAASVPTLTIAIPDSVLAMPSFDPWAHRGDPLRAANDRRDSELASDRLPGDEAYVAFRGQVEREHRSSVVQAAAAATAALSQAAGSAEAARVAAAARRAVSPRAGSSAASGSPPRGANPLPWPAPAAPDLLSLPPADAVPPAGAHARAGTPAGLVITGSVVAPRSRIDLSQPIASPRLQEQVVLAADADAGAPPDGIPAEALRRVLKVLSAHLGPIAGDVLKHVAGRARTIPELHKLLLEQAGAGVDKKRMAKQLKAVAKLPL
jgi:serine/threonine-protein kinase